jgi:hypothetical protein
MLFYISSVPLAPAALLCYILFIFELAAFGTGSAGAQGLLDDSQHSFTV